MPRSQRKAKPDEPDGRRWLIVGHRVGTQFLTSKGIFLNGSSARSDLLSAIRAQGYDPIVVTDDEVADPGPTQQDLDDVEAANRILGVDTLETGKTRIQSEIDQGMRDFTRRLHKSTYLR